MSVYRATRLDHAEKINRVSRYIAEHIGEPIELRVIARVGGFSPYHFHRVFLAAVGETVGDHIRRLRLRHAAKELVSSPSSITRIAFDAGFESSAAFSKAFRKGFGMTPTQFRLNGKWVASIDSLTLRRRPSIQPEMCYVPSKTIYYIRASGVGDGSYCNVAPKAYDALWKYLASTGLSDEVEELVGTVPHDLALAAERNVLYDAGVAGSHSHTSFSGDALCRFSARGPLRNALADMECHLQELVSVLRRRTPGSLSIRNLS
jgi:AraC family transcriptional regulator